MADGRVVEACEGGRVRAQKAKGAANGMHHVPIQGYELLFPTSCFLLPTSCFLLPTSCFLLLLPPTSYFLLPTSIDFLLPASYFPLPAPYCLTSGAHRVPLED